MLTEDEAKEKWCPMLRKLVVNGDISISEYERRPDTNCIASDCMVWVFGDSNYISPCCNKGVIDEHLANFGGDYKCTECKQPFLSSKMIEVKKGYCGLRRSN